MALLPLRIKEALLEVLQNPLVTLFNLLWWAFMIVRQLCWNLGFIIAIVIAIAASLLAFTILLVYELCRFIFFKSLPKAFQLIVKTVPPARAWEDSFTQSLPDIVKEQLQVFLWCFVMIFASRRAFRILQDLGVTAQCAFWCAKSLHKILDFPPVQLAHELLLEIGLWSYISELATRDIILPFVSRCALIATNRRGLAPPAPVIHLTILLDFGQWFWLFIKAPHKNFALLLATLLDISSWILYSAHRLIAVAPSYLKGFGRSEFLEELGQNLFLTCAIGSTLTLKSWTSLILHSRFPVFARHFGSTPWNTPLPEFPVSVYSSNHIIGFPMVNNGFSRIMIFGVDDEIFHHVGEFEVIVRTNPHTSNIRKYIIISVVLIVAPMALSAFVPRDLAFDLSSKLQMIVQNWFGPELHAIRKSVNYVYPAIHCIFHPELRKEDLSLGVYQMLTRTNNEVLKMLFFFFFFSEILLAVIFCVRLPFLILSFVVHQVIYGYHVLSTYLTELPSVCGSMAQQAMMNILPLATIITAVWIAIFTFILLVGIPALLLITAQYILHRLCAIIFTVALLSNFLLPDIMERLDEAVHQIFKTIHQVVETIYGAYETILSDPLVVVRLIRIGVRLATKVAVHHTGALIAGICVSGIAMNFVIVGFYDKIMLVGGKSLFFYKEQR